MFTREEASRTRHAFWTAFGKYMRPVRAAEDMKVNWINYHTGLKGVYFRMDADQKSASISISIEHEDEAIREIYFEQFGELKHVLHNVLQEEWDWQVRTMVNNRIVSRIVKTRPGVSVFNEADWPEIISFFKPRIIALDSFWMDAKYSFPNLK